MRLTRLWVDSLPGIPDRFDFAAKAGLNLITGPNGIGKSSVARALAHLLWPRRDLGEALPEVRAEFAIGDRLFGASCHRETRTTWTENGQAIAPPVLPEDHLASCYHLDILDLMPAGAHPDDDQLARELVKELSGGVDLASTREELFSLKGLAVSNRRTALVAARRKVAEVEDRQRDLARRQNTLIELSEELAAAQQAAQRQDILQMVARRAVCLTRLEQLHQELETMPPGTARVQAQDPKSLAQRRQEQRRRLDQRNETDGQIARLQEELSALGGPADPGLSGPWETLRRRIQDLRAAEDAVREAQRRLQETTGARERAQAAAPAVLPDSVVSAGLDPDIVRKAVALVGRLHRHRMQAEAYQTRLQAAGQADHGLPRRLVLAPGILLLMLAAGLLLVPGGRMSALVCGVLSVLTMGIGLAIRFRRRGRQGDAADHERANAVLLDRERKDLEQVRQDLADLLTGVGLPLDLDDPSIPLLLDRILNLAKTHEEHSRCRQQHALALERREQDLEALNRELRDLGCAPIAGSIPAEQVMADLENRWARRRALVEEIDQLDRRRQGLTADVDQLERYITGQLADLGLEPGPQEDRQVNRLLDLKPRYDALAVETRDAEQEIRRLDQDIAAGRGLFGSETPLELSVAELALRIERETQLAGRRDDLNQRIGALDREIQLAQAGHDLEEARAHRARAEHDLAGTFNQNLFLLLGRELLDTVRDEHRAQSRPPALQAAGDLFRTITSQPYELQHTMHPDGSAEFVVWDRELGRHYSPAELSAGTRTQLFLAVRLGFLAGAEPGPHPPLILDDALIASDPLRFTAAVTSLGRLAAAGERQVFYLCSRPAEVQAWRQILQEHGLEPPHVIDLALIRARAVAAPQEVLGNWDPSARDGLLPPSPAGLGPAAYAAALQVPPPQPWSPPDSLHLFYLLEDRLELLHRLVLAGTGTVGRWRSGLAGLRQAGAVTPQEGELVDARVLVWELILSHWRIGRARPIPPDFLEKSDAVSRSTLRPKVQELLARVNGDGQALLSGLRDKRIPKFRTETIDRLQGELTEGGYLAPTPTLDREQLLQAVVLGASGLIRSKILNTEMIHLLVDRFEVVLSKRKNVGQSSDFLMRSERLT